jgi:putative colanic acid biosynthesis UDP-glucose lipid carrier transferase
MRENTEKFIRAVFLTGDLFLVNASFLFAFWMRFGNFDEFGKKQFAPLLITINLMYIILAYFQRSYSIERILKVEKMVKSVLKLFVIHSLLVFTYLIVIRGSGLSREFLFYQIGSSTAVVFLWRFAGWYILNYYRKTGITYKRIVIIGSGPLGKHIRRHLESDASMGYQVVAMFETKTAEDGRKAMVEDIEDVQSFILKNEIDEIFISLPLTETKLIQEMVGFADNNAIRFRLIPDFRGVSNRKMTLSFEGNLPMLVIRAEPLESLANRFVKRMFDIVFSLGVILVFGPILFPVLALFIKLGSKGPIFFTQKRTGRGREEFLCYKFRSMEVNEKADSLQAVKDDPRVTKIGAFMRKTNLDEIPQFWNVLVGNMSVVGPRPHMIRHTEDYKKIIDKFMVRQFVKPGITGWAQVNGFRGVTNNKKMRKRVQYDVWYIEHWSLLLDLRIIFMTVFNMAKGEENAF